MMFRFILLLMFFASCGFRLNAADPEVMAKQVFTLIYNQQFDAAKAAISAHKTELEPFYATVLTLDLYWWEYSMNRSKQTSQQLKTLLNDLEQQEAVHHDKIKRLIYKSYEMRYERKRYNWVKALFIRSEINELLTELDSEAIRLPDKQLQLFKLYISMFRYFEFINPLSLLNKPEERLKFLREMEHFAGTDDWVVSTLAHYFLGRIYLKIERDTQKGREHFRLLSNRFPRNLLFRAIADGTDQKF